MNAIGTIMIFAGLVVPPHWEEVKPTSQLYQGCQIMLRGDTTLKCIIKVDDK